MSKGPYTLSKLHNDELPLVKAADVVKYRCLVALYANELYIHVRAYDSLFAETGKSGKDQGIFISRNDFALYAFDVTADLGKDDHFNLIIINNNNNDDDIYSAVIYGSSHMREFTVVHLGQSRSAPGGRQLAGQAANLTFESACRLL